MKGKNHQGKTPSGEFKVTTPENPLLSIISGCKYKESYQTLWPIPKYQPTVEPLPQLEKDCWLQSSSVHQQ